MMNKIIFDKLISIYFYCGEHTGIYTDTIHPLIDGIAISLGYKIPIYAVILDAGSTGSRVIGFEFHKGYSDGRLVLDRELFLETKPGLSAFHDQPKEVCNKKKNCFVLARKTWSRFKNGMPDFWLFQYPTFCTDNFKSYSMRGKKFYI